MPWKADDNPEDAYEVDYVRNGLIAGHVVVTLSKNDEICTIWPSKDELKPEWHAERDKWYAEAERRVKMGIIRALESR